MASKSKSPRRARHDAATTKSLILDAVEQLMIDDGYAAVSIRNVAKRAGLLPALVQYHYPSSDEMLLAAYRRGTQISSEALLGVVNSTDSLRALWAYETDSTHNVLAREFIALANRHKVIKAEIAAYSERSRQIKSEIFEKMVDPTVVDPKIFPPICAAVFIVCIGRTLTTEEAVGISAGHKEVRAFVDWMIDHIKRPSPSKARALPRRNRNSRDKGSSECRGV